MSAFSAQIQDIDGDYSKDILKRGYFKNTNDDDLNQFLLLLALYERIHDFGGTRPRNQDRDKIKKSIDSMKRTFLDGPLLFGKKIHFTFTSGKVENFFGELIEENVLFDRNPHPQPLKIVDVPEELPNEITECEIVTLDENDEALLSSDSGRTKISEFIYKFFGCTGQRIKLICDAVGGSNSLLGKVLSKKEEFIYCKTIATLFDSAGTVDKLFINLDESDNRRNKFLDTGELKIYLQSFPGGSGGPLSVAKTFIEKELQKENVIHKREYETISKKFGDNHQKIRQGPSVMKLGCEIANEQQKEDCNNATTTNSKMYIFSDILKDMLTQLSSEEDRKQFEEDRKQFEEDRKHFLFELKRNGDHLQVLITHYLNWKKFDGAYHIFCSIDRLAIHFARLLKIPCILVKSDAGILKLYKGMDSDQKATALTEREIKIMSLKIEKKKLEKKLEDLNNLRQMERDKLFQKFNKEFKKFYTGNDAATPDVKFEAILNFLDTTLNGCLLMVKQFKQKIEKKIEKEIKKIKEIEKKIQMQKQKGITDKKVITELIYLNGLLNNELGSINESIEIFNNKNIPSLSVPELSVYIDKCIGIKHMIPFYRSNVNSLRELSQLGNSGTFSPSLNSIFTSLNKGKIPKKKFIYFVNNNLLIDFVDIRNINRELTLISSAKRPRQDKIDKKQDDYNEKDKEINNHYIRESIIQNEIEPNKDESKIQNEIRDIETKLGQINDELNDELNRIEPPDVVMGNTEGGSYKITNKKKNIQKFNYQKGGDDEAKLSEADIEKSAFSEDFINYLFKYNVFSQEDNLLEEQNRLFEQFSKKFSKEEICQDFLLNDFLIPLMSKYQDSKDIYNMLNDIYEWKTLGRLTHFQAILINIINQPNIINNRIKNLFSTLKPDSTNNIDFGKCQDTTAVGYETNLNICKKNIYEFLIKNKNLANKRYNTLFLLVSSRSCSANSENGRGRGVGAEIVNKSMGRADEMHLKGVDEEEARERRENAAREMAKKKKKKPN